jgi:hypothetical protein
MRELSIEQLEGVSGGGFMDGACAVFAFAGAAAGVGALVGAVSLGPIGVGTLAIGGVACLAYSLW